MPANEQQCMDCLRTYQVCTYGLRTQAYALIEEVVGDNEGS